MLTFLQEQGVRFIRCPGYPDYYSNRKGGHDDGRAVEPAPWAGRKLGEWLPKLQPGLAEGVGLSVTTNEARSLALYNRTLRTFGIAARVVARTALGKIRRQALQTNGASLIGQMLSLALARGVTVWTEAPVSDLISEDGRVVGVQVMHQGTTRTVHAEGGVLLAAGGFARNPDMRRTYGGDQPNEAEYTLANPGDTGDMIRAGLELGAKTDLMDEAWWFPSPAGEGALSTLSHARNRPGSIIVDQAGRRFANESNSYMEIGQAMYARNKDVRAVPSWLILDDGYRRRYAHQRSRPGRFPRQMLKDGTIKMADTIEELARKCGIDPDGLADTVRRFNEHAVRGADPEFGRGESAYNRALGDPSYRPNPCIGPLDRAPFYATHVVPADIGTCGGFVVNEHGQVMNQSDQPIPGLYATGNNTATVMGRHYLGPGASIAHSMVFGYLAARHAAERVNR